MYIVEDTENVLPYILPSTLMFNLIIIISQYKVALSLNTSTNYTT